MNYRLVALLALTTLVAVTGCAVLRVDVDVYKGPMANNDRVQLDELAVMAVGAKPLLVQLRDNLESPDDPKALHTKAWYKSGYIGNIPGQPHVLEQPNAERIDAILSLYEDESPDRFRVLFEEGARVLQTYRTAWNAFVATDPDGPRSWAHLSQALREQAVCSKHGRCETQHSLMRTSGSSDVKTYNAYVRRLSQSYCACLNPQEAAWRWDYGEVPTAEEGCKEKSCPHRDDCIVHVHEYLQKNSQGKAQIASLPSLEVFGNDLLARVSGTDESQHSPALMPGANSLFGALSRPDVVRAHAELLFRDECTNEREDFVTEVNRVASSFADARHALHDLNRLVLEGLALSDPKEVLDEARRNARDAAIEMTYRLIKPAKLKAGIKALAMIESAAEGTSEAALWQAFGTSQISVALQPPSSRPTHAFWTALEQIPDPGVPCAQQEAEYHLQFKAFMDTCTAEAATLFLCADGALRRLDKFSGSIPGPYRYGLTRGPMGSGEGVLDPGPLSDMFQQIAKGYAFGLERGRLPLGIESMIEAQLKTHELKAAMANQPLSSEDDKLLSALVQFATKVLVMANNELLLEYGMPLTRGPGVPSSHDDAPAVAPTHQHRRMLRQSTAVLQSIGNAILTEVDDVRNREEHRRRLIAAKDTEINVIRDVAGKIPNMPADVAKGATDAHDALNRLDAALFELRLCATEEGDDEQVLRLEQCIKQVKARRVNLAFLRPASAYLRNSYTTTLVQAKPSTSWENMLDEQVMRSTVVGEMLKTFANSSKTRQTEEVDKQFWQNINSVRVAGAGRTNYVVAKDDIGNWSVRNFSADPEPIFKGAKDLLTYSVGVARAGEAAKKAAMEAAEKAKAKKKGRKGRRLIRIQPVKINNNITINNAKERAAAGNASDSGAGFAPGGPVTKMLARAEKDYWDATRTSLDSLNKWLKDDVLTRDIKSAWKEKQSDVRGLEPKLTEAAKTYLKPVKDDIAGVIGELDEADDALRKDPEQLHEKLGEVDPGAHILAALQEIRRFHNALIRTIPDDESNPKNTQSARSAVSNAVWPRMKEFLDSRTKAAGSLQSALQLMNAGVNE